MASTVSSQSPFVIMLGPPASGKSTLVRVILTRNPDLGRFVVRQQIAEEQRNGTDLWEAARIFVDKGAWIPDAVMAEMFARSLRHHRSTGMLLEGLPANGTQAVMVRDLLEAHGVPAKWILYLDAPDEVCAARVRNRWVCPSCEDGMAPARPDPAALDRCYSCAAVLARRDDDTEATFIKRLRVHRRNIGAILAAYRPEEVVVLDASQSPAAIAIAAMAVLAGRGDGS